MKRFLSHLPAVACAFFLLGAATDTQARDKVTYAYATNISLSNAPTLMAKGMGYFEQEGLDVTVTFFQGAATMLPQVTQKHIEFGWINPNVLISSKQPGRDAIPVRMFYNGIYQYTYEMMVPEGSPIQSLKDLKGKKIGVGAMSWGNLAFTKTMLKEEGLVFQKDYDFVPVGIGATAMRALQNGDIDALNLFDTLHVQMEIAGAKLRRLPEQQKYRDLFSSGWAAHQDLLRERPDLIIRFARAASKGVVACDANVEACVRNFWTLYPTTKPATGTEEQKLADAVRILKVRLATMLPPGGPAEMGRYSARSWGDFVEAMYQGGEISTDKIAVDDLYTNELVDKINDFDVEAVVAEARRR